MAAEWILNFPLNGTRLGQAAMWRYPQGAREVYNRIQSYTSRPMMRTNIVVDDELMDEALKLTGARTKREAVELGLRTLVRLKRQERIRAYRGKLDWQGDLERMRIDS